MLRRIHKLEIRDIKSWKGEFSFDFDDRITVIRGVNGAGKTTIAQILMLTIVRSAKGDMTKNLLTPSTGGSPYSSVTFSTDDGKYMINKTWGDVGQTKLIDVESMEIISTGGEAEDMAAKMAFEMESKSQIKHDGLISLLNSSVENYLASLTFHSQGNLHLAPKMGAHLRNIGLAIDQAELSKAFEKIDLATNKESKKYISAIGKSGKPTKTAKGLIIDKEAELNALIKDFEEAEKVSEELKRAEKKLYALEENQQNVSEENRIEKRDQIITLRDGVETHRKLREDASEELRKTKEQFEPVKNNYDLRLKLIEELSKINEKLESATKKLNDAGKELSVTKSNYEKTKSSVEEVKNTIELVNKWDKFLGFKERKKELEISLKRNQEDLNALEKDSVKLQKTEKLLKNLKLAGNQWENIRELDREIKSIQTTKTMNVRLNKGIGDMVVIADGVKVEKDGAASERIEIKSGKDLVLEVLQLSEGQSLEQLKHEFQETLEKLNAKSIKELNEREKQSIKYQTTIVNIKEAIKKYESKEAYLNRITDLKTKLSSKEKRPKDNQPSEDLEELKIQLPIRKDILTKEHEMNNASYIQALAIEKVCKEQLIDQQKLSTESEQLLSNHRENFGKDEEMELKFSEQERELQKKEKIVNEIEKNKELREAIPEKRAKTLENDLRKFDDSREATLTLKESVKQLRNNTKLENINALESNIEIENERLNSLEIEFSALTLISSLSAESKDLHQEESRSEITNEINHLFAYVLDRDSNIRLGDDGSASSAGLVKFVEESHGTKEQLQIIHRLVLLLKHSNRGTTMMLDDALVSSSTGRLNRIKNVILNAAENGMQFIIFSCKEEEYDDIADEIISLD